MSEKVAEDFSLGGARIVHIFPPRESDLSLMCTLKTDPSGDETKMRGETGFSSVCFFCQYSYRIKKKMRSQEAKEKRQSLDVLSPR